MSRPYRVSFSASALRRIEKERVWIHNHYGLERADAFEQELRHRLELVGDNPEMGPASGERDDERCTYLHRSRFHVFYLVSHEHEVIRVVRLRHARQDGPQR